MLALAVGCIVGTGIAQDEARRQDGAIALVLDIRDAIGPATSNYFVRALEGARERKARLIILQLDTPGGLDSAMREMIQAILASPIPVAIYVSPSGARAASAGTYLLYASHVAAMAPATNLGAATPVQIGATPSQPASTGDKEKDDKEKDDKDRRARHRMERKVVNDSIAYIRGLAELRGRNAEWAESAVRSATSLTASGAGAESHRYRCNRPGRPVATDERSRGENERG